MQKQGNREPGVSCTPNIGQRHGVLSKNLMLLPALSLDATDLLKQTEEARCPVGEHLTVDDAVTVHRLHLNAFIAAKQKNVPS